MNMRDLDNYITGHGGEDQLAPTWLSAPEWGTTLNPSLSTRSCRARKLVERLPSEYVLKVHGRVVGVRSDAPDPRLPAGGQKKK
jgi:hypothetical protein